jgi:predicted transcriptional regulator
MKVLLSIKPEFAEKIFSGEKKYEFRRVLFKNKQIRTIIVYASSPVQKIIGEFEIEQILSEDPETLWQQTKEHSGITRDFFFSYFRNKATAHAIKVKCARRYRQPLCIKKDFNTSPPQSFQYI